VAREYKLRNLIDLMKESLVHLIVEGIKRVVALRKAEAKWPRDFLPVRVIRQYMECPSLEVYMEIWARDLALKSIDQDFEVQDRSTGERQVSSDRKNSAIVALKGRITIEQIQSIGGWMSGAVQLYTRAISTAEMGASRLIGFN
ncbi:1541_t:CDS:2, partial [Scutellospora calospora]